MPDLNDDIQAEILKVANAIKSLEELRGKIPESDLESALATYRQKLHNLIEQARGKVSKEEVASSRTGFAESHLLITINAEHDAYASYVSAPGEPALSEDEFKYFLGQYLTWADNTYASVGLYGLDYFHAEGGRLTRPLRDMYLPPVLASFDPHKLNYNDVLVDEATTIKGDYDILEERQANGNLIPLADLLTSSKHLAVIGVAGSGKSTLLSYLTTCLVTNAQKGKLLPFGLPKGCDTLIPVIIPIRIFVPYLDQTMLSMEKEKQEAEKNPRQPSAEQPGSSTGKAGAKKIEKNSELAGVLAQFIHEYIGNCVPELKQSKDLFERLLRGNGCLLMLDGLDEINKPEKRSIIREQVDNLVKNVCPNGIVLVTAREVGVSIPGAPTGSGIDAVVSNDFSFLHLRRLDKNSKGSEQMVLTWVRQFNPRKTDILNHDIMQVINDLNNKGIVPGLPPLISTPLMINLIISARLGTAEWPPDELRLLEMLIKAILKHEPDTNTPGHADKINWGGTSEEQLEWLTTLAYEMHRTGVDGTTIPETKLRFLLKDIVPERSLDQFIAAVRQRGILLEERAGMFRLAHLIFQRYLAVRMIVHHKENALDELEFQLSKPWWYSVLMQVIHYAELYRPSFAPRYLEWLVKFQLVGLDLAGAALLEAKNPKADERSKIAQALAIALTDKKGTATSLQRASAGTTLGRLGDPRFHNKDAWFLPVEPLFGFVLIPGGAYLIGSNPERDADANSKEVPLHELAMYPFYIARYPVTVAEYRTFVADSGYTLSDPHSLEGIPNHPVTWITWDDANAYCQWLEKKLANWVNSPPELAEKLKSGDWELTLPNEAEWESAARGPRARLYPWSGQFDPKKANTNETHIDTTTAVGSFPNGESQFGVLDLCGNVWEWTRSVYRIYYYNSADGREDTTSRDFHVLRGGAFNQPHQSCRCPFRNMYYPDYKDEATGFRTVIHQTYEYVEEEIEVEVPLEEGEISPDGKETKTVTQTIFVRKPLVIEGPKQDR